MRCFSLVTVLFLTSCMLGPNYHPPKNCVPNQWHSEGTVSTEAPLVAWWSVFQDPLLEHYILCTARHNRALHAAEANILQARATRMVTASPLFPRMGADLGAMETYFSSDGPRFAIEEATDWLPKEVTSRSFEFPFDISQTRTFYNANVDALWELDLFGKTRRQVESADYTIGSVIEQRNDLLLSLFAEVARNYVEVRSNQAQAALLLDQITLLKREEALVHLLVEKGYTNQLELESSEVLLAAARAELPALWGAIYRNVYALSVLTGNLPETLLCEMLPIRPLPEIPATVAIGVRSDLLRRRPDVRRSERRLGAATANIGVAIASFLPSVDLLAGLGIYSLFFGEFFQLPLRICSAGANMSVPLFRGGALIGNLRLNEAAACVAAYNYQDTVLKAVQEAESGLVTFVNDRVALESLQAVVTHNRNLTRLTEEQVSKGLVSALTLLPKEVELNSAEQNLLQGKTKVLLDLITLYKAIGGGWQILPCCP